MRMTSTCVSAHINIYPQIHRGACTQPPPWLVTRARARSSTAYFFLPRVSSQLYNGFTTEGKKRGISLFFSLHTQPHKFVFTPQLRNFVLRKFSAHLWEIIRSSKIVCVARFRDSHSDMSLLSHINAFSAKSFCLGSLACVTVARSPPSWLTCSR